MLLQLLMSSVNDFGPVYMFGPTIPNAIHKSDPRGLFHQGQVFKKAICLLTGGQLHGSFLHPGSFRSGQHVRFTHAGAFHLSKGTDGLFWFFEPEDFPTQHKLKKRVKVFKRNGEVCECIQVF